MAYSYCYKCKDGLSKPTIRECLTEEQICPYCEHPNSITDSTYILAGLLEELEERISKLEQSK